MIFLSNAIFFEKNKERLQKNMKTVAIISEFNPFHQGHALLFRRIKERLGNDTAIISIMSGNYVQRGEPAILPKQARAESAVRGGADLVLELPFPYSMSSAERFARAGVYIADAIGCVDYLAFGSEAGDTEPLLRIAKNIECDEYRSSYLALSADQTIGSAEKTARAYAQLYGKETNLLHPNNILGIEYIRALLRLSSRITPITFAREGAGHDEPNTDTTITNASTLRTLLQHGDLNAFYRKVPNATRDIVDGCIQKGETPVSAAPLHEYALLYYRLSSAEKLSNFDGLGDGLAERFINAAKESATPDQFLERVRTKRYTDAYLRRAMLYGLFGITREQLNSPPSYTQVLGMTANGQKILANVRKTTSIPILTKPADYKQLSPRARDAAECVIRADSLYSALLPRRLAPSDQLRYSPYREE